MNIPRLLEKRSAIYGTCAIWIILFHVLRKVTTYIPVFSDVIAAGTPVAVFLFLSGLSLYLSAEKHHYMENHWKGYLKRRLERVLVPYLIVGVPYYLWNCIYETQGSVLKRVLVFFANLSSATFWLYGRQTTWYVYGIIVCYCLFPFMYRFVKQRSGASQMALFAGLIVFAIIASYIPILKNSIIVWSRLPVFFSGVMIGEATKKRESDFVPKSVQIAALILVILIGALISRSEISETFTLPYVFRNLLALPMTLSLMLLLSLKPQKRKLPVLEWLGGLSLELYLVHITLLHPIKYYGILDAVDAWLYLLLPAVSIPLAWIVKKIEEYILKRI